MSEADQGSPDQPSCSQSSVAEGRPAVSAEESHLSTYQVVPCAAPKSDDELFSFRQVVEKPSEPVVEAAARPPFRLHIPVFKIVIAFAIASSIGLAVLAFPSVFNLKPPPAFIDLGSERFDPAGLSGRLIAKWDSGGSYQLALDPIDSEHLASFAAVAQDPPRQLSITIRLRDSEGLVSCEKQILLPAPRGYTTDATPAPGANVANTPSGAASPASTADAAAEGVSETTAKGPQQTATGDTVEIMTGENGQIGEIDLTGSLPCGAKAYSASKSWDFISDFPTPAEQNEWLRHVRETNAKSHAKAAAGSGSARLSAALDGDDMIVADNPSHGTVETRSGRVFYLGSAGMQKRTAEWQVFPAAIHFHCEKNGSCALTRPGSLMALRGRLLR